MRTYYGWIIQVYYLTEVQNMWMGVYYAKKGRGMFPYVIAPTLRELKAKIKAHVKRWGW